MMGGMATTCKKCGGTGLLTWTGVDRGRCWACLPAAKAPSADVVAYDEFWRRANAAKAYFPRRVFAELFEPYVPELRRLEAATGYGR